MAVNSESIQQKWNCQQSRFGFPAPVKKRSWDDLEHCSFPSPRLTWRGNEQRQIYSLKGFDEEVSRPASHHYLPLSPSPNKLKVDSAAPTKITGWGSFIGDCTIPAAILPLVEPQNTTPQAVKAESRGGHDQTASWRTAVFPSWRFKLHPGLCIPSFIGVGESIGKTRGFLTASSPTSKCQRILSPFERNSYSHNEHSIN